ncbi:MAG: TSUP family transporter [Lachnospiraceae bacterium]
MIYFLFFIICFIASVIGAICGIGGGVMIKPILDSYGIFDVTTISFLSGCTVLAMATYSVIKSKMKKTHKIGNQTIFLAVGATIGGIIGKNLFAIVKNMNSDINKVGAIQSLCLFVITIGTLIYTLNKKKIHTKKTKSYIVCIVIGLLLGGISSFLGLGGGPINLIVLFYFFSMDTKEAAENSLYIIFFSQIAALLSTVLTSTVPNFQVSLLITMVIGGILGGIGGRSANGYLKSDTIEKIFIVLMIFMIGINFYNFIKFS